MHEATKEQAHLMFQTLDNIHQRLKDKKRQKVLKQVHNFLQHLESYFSSLAPKNIPEIFYERMQQEKNLISRETYSAFKQAFELFRDSLDSKTAQYKPLISLLIDYITAHDIDPDNSLIGLSVSSKLVKELGLFTDQSNTLSSSRQTYEDMISRERLHQKIIDWSEVKDDFIKDEVCALADIIRRVTGIGFTKGELLLYRSNNKIYFTRFVRRDGDKVFMFNAPDEKQTISAHPNDISIIPSKMKDMINSGNVRTLQSMAHNPIDEFVADLCQQVEGYIYDFLRENKIDINLLDKTNQAGVLPLLIYDLDSIKTLAKRLVELRPDPSSPLFQKINDLYLERFRSFKQTFDISTVFPTLRSEASLHLRASAITKFARTFYETQEHRTETTVEQLELLLKEVANGEKKNELTTWWLKLIFQRANDFLAKKNYNFDAVPEDYIETRPENMDGVRANFKLIQEILCPGKDIHEVKKFVAALREEIYPRIEEYLDIVKRVIGYKLKTRNEETHILEACLAKADIDEESRTWIGNLLKDVSYIEEMKVMEADFQRKEENPQETKEKLVLSTVVPISGLILGHFHILENILRTVLEVWGRDSEDQKSQTATTSSTVSSPQSPSSPIKTKTSPEEDEELDDISDVLFFLRNTKPPANESNPPKKPEASNNANGTVSGSSSPRFAEVDSGDKGDFAFTPLPKSAKIANRKSIKYHGLLPSTAPLEELTSPELKQKKDRPLPPSLLSSLPPQSNPSSTPSPSPSSSSTTTTTSSSSVTRVSLLTPSPLLSQILASHTLSLPSNPTTSTSSPTSPNVSASGSPSNSSPSSSSSSLPSSPTSAKMWPSIPGNPKPKVGLGTTSGELFPSKPPRPVLPPRSRSNSGFDEDGLLISAQNNNNNTSTHPHPLSESHNYNKPTPTPPPRGSINTSSSFSSPPAQKLPPPSSIINPTNPNPSSNQHPAPFSYVNAAAAADKIKLRRISEAPGVPPLPPSSSSDGNSSRQTEAPISARARISALNSSSVK